MSDKAKTIAGFIAIGVSILLSLTGYIYAEATGARSRDTKAIAYVVEQDLEIRKQLAKTKHKQLQLLSDIKIVVNSIEKDIEFIKAR